MTDKTKQGRQQWPMVCSLSAGVTASSVISSGYTQTCTAHFRYGLILMSHTLTHSCACTYPHVLCSIPALCVLHVDCFLHQTTTIVSSVHSVQPVVKPVKSCLSGTVTTDNLLSVKRWRGGKKTGKPSVILCRMCFSGSPCSWPHSLSQDVLSAHSMKSCNPLYSCFVS